MFLKQIIDNTDTEKNKLKRAKINIDNKLVAVGGSRATNLADVPNRIQELRNGLIKYATGDLSWKTYSSPWGSNTYMEVNVPLGLTFKPQKLNITILTKHPQTVRKTIDAFSGGDVSLSTGLVEFYAINSNSFKPDGSVTLGIYKNNDFAFEFCIEKFEAFEK